MNSTLVKTLHSCIPFRTIELHENCAIVKVDHEARIASELQKSSPELQENVRQHYEILQKTLPVLSVPLQNGTIPEAGDNGFMIENLIEVAIARIEQYNRGEWVCEENNMALDHLTAAKNALLARTAKRVARNVEGTMVP